MPLTTGDSKSIIHLPIWIKFILLTVLASVLATGVYVSVSFIGYDDRADWIILSLSLAQLSGTALVILLVLLFSESDASVANLERRSQEYLKTHLPAALRRMTVPAAGGHPFECSGAMNRDIFGALFYLGDSRDLRMKAWVGLNVRRITVIYFIKGAEGRKLPIEKAQDLFRYTFGAAEKIGYSVFFEEADVDGEKLISIWATVAVEDDFLVLPQAKLFWAQDVAMMTQSFVRTAYRARATVSLHTTADPQPL